MSAKKLHDKVAIITGASKGLGKAMALALAGAGAKLALVSRNLDQLNEVAKEARAAGGEAKVFVADVTSEEQVEKLGREVVAAFGGVQILINNAGISPGPFATEMNTALMQNPEVNQQFLSKIPLGRWGKVEEIGQLALYLCSEDAGFITGTDILIDGGWCAQ